MNNELESIASRLLSILHDLQEQAQQTDQALEQVFGLEENTLAAQVQQISDALLTYQRVLSRFASANRRSGFEYLQRGLENINATLEKLNVGRLESIKKGITQVQDLLEQLTSLQDKQLRMVLQVAESVVTVTTSITNLSDAFRALGTTIQEVEPRLTNVFTHMTRESKLDEIVDSLTKIESILHKIQEEELKANVDVFINKVRDVITTLDVLRGRLSAVFRHYHRLKLSIDYDAFERDLVKVVTSALTQVSKTHSLVIPVTGEHLADVGAATYGRRKRRVGSRVRTLRSPDPDAPIPEERRPIPPTPATPPVPRSQPVQEADMEQLHRERAALQAKSPRRLTPEQLSKQEERIAKTQQRAVRKTQREMERWIQRELTKAGLEHLIGQVTTVQELAEAIAKQKEQLLATMTEEERQQRYQQVVQEHKTKKRRPKETWFLVQKPEELIEEERRYDPSVLEQQLMQQAAEREAAALAQQEQQRRSRKKSQKQEPVPTQERATPQAVQQPAQEPAQEPMQEPAQEPVQELTQKKTRKTRRTVTEKQSTVQVESDVQVTQEVTVDTQKPSRTKGKQPTESVSSSVSTAAEPSLSEPAQTSGSSETKKTRRSSTQRSKVPQTDEEKALALPLTTIAALEKASKQYADVTRAWEEAQEYASKQLLSFLTYKIIAELDQQKAYIAQRWKRSADEVEKAYRMVAAYLLDEASVSEQERASELFEQAYTEIRQRILYGIDLWYEKVMPGESIDKLVETEQNDVWRQKLRDLLARSSRQTPPSHDDAQFLVTAEDVQEKARTSRGLLERLLTGMSSVTSGTLAWLKRFLSQIKEQLRDFEIKIDIQVNLVPLVQAIQELRSHIDASLSGIAVALRSLTSFTQDTLSPVTQEMHRVLQTLRDAASGLLDVRRDLSASLRDVLRTQMTRFDVANVSTLARQLQVSLAFADAAHEQERWYQQFKGIPEVATWMTRVVHGDVGSFDDLRAAIHAQAEMLSPDVQERMLRFVQELHESLASGKQYRPAPPEHVAITQRDITTMAALRQQGYRPLVQVLSKLSSLPVEALELQRKRAKDVFEQQAIERLILTKQQSETISRATQQELLLLAQAQLRYYAGIQSLASSPFDAFFAPFAAVFERIQQQLEDLATRADFSHVKEAFVTANQHAQRLVDTLRNSISSMEQLDTLSQAARTFASTLSAAIRSANETFVQTLTYSYERFDAIKTLADQMHRAFQRVVQTTTQALRSLQEQLQRIHDVARVYTDAAENLLEYANTVEGGIMPMLRHLATAPSFPVGKSKTLPKREAGETPVVLEHAIQRDITYGMYRSVVNDAAFEEDRVATYLETIRRALQESKSGVVVLQSTNLPFEGDNDTVGHTMLAYRDPTKEQGFRFVHLYPEQNLFDLVPLERLAEKAEEALRQAFSLQAIPVQFITPEQAQAWVRRIEETIADSKTKYGVVQRATPENIHFETCPSVVVRAANELNIIPKDVLPATLANMNVPTPFALMSAIAMLNKGIASEGTPLHYVRQTRAFVSGTEEIARQRAAETVQDVVRALEALSRGTAVQALYLHPLVREWKQRLEEERDIPALDTTALASWATQELSLSEEDKRLFARHIQALEYMAKEKTPDVAVLSTISPQITPTRRDIFALRAFLDRLYAQAGTEGTDVTSLYEYVTTRSDTFDFFSRYTLAALQQAKQAATQEERQTFLLRALALSTAQIHHAAAFSEQDNVPVSPTELQHITSLLLDQNQALFLRADATATEQEQPKQRKRNLVKLLVEDPDRFWKGLVGFARAYDAFWLILKRLFQFDLTGLIKAINTLKNAQATMRKYWMDEPVPEKPPEPRFTSRRDVAEYAVKLFARPFVGLPRSPQRDIIFSQVLPSLLEQGKDIRPDASYFRDIYTVLTPERRQRLPVQALELQYTFLKLLEEHGFELTAEERKKLEYLEKMKEKRAAAYRQETTSKDDEEGGMSAPPKPSPPKSPPPSPYEPAPTKPAPTKPAPTKPAPSSDVTQPRVSASSFPSLQELQNEQYWRFYAGIASTEKQQWTELSTTLAEVLAQVNKQNVAEAIISAFERAVSLLSDEEILSKPVLRDALASILAFRRLKPKLKLPVLLSDLYAKYQEQLAEDIQSAMRTLVAALKQSNAPSDIDVAAVDRLVSETKPRVTKKSTLPETFDPEAFFATIEQQLALLKDPSYIARVTGTAKSAAQLPEYAFQQLSASDLAVLLHEANAYSEEVFLALLRILSTVSAEQIALNDELLLLFAAADKYRQERGIEWSKRLKLVYEEVKDLVEPLAASIKADINPALYDPNQAFDASRPGFTRRKRYATTPQAEQTNREKQALALRALFAMSNVYIPPDLDEQTIVSLTKLADALKYYEDMGMPLSDLLRKDIENVLTAAKDKDTDTSFLRLPVVGRQTQLVRDTLAAKKVAVDPETVQLIADDIAHLRDRFLLELEGLLLNRALSDFTDESSAFTTYAGTTQRLAVIPTSITDMRFVEKVAHELVHAIVHPSTVSPTPVPIDPEAAVTALQQIPTALSKRIRALLQTKKGVDYFADMNEALAFHGQALMTGDTELMRVLQAVYTDELSRTVSVVVRDILHELATPDAFLPLAASIRSLIPSDRALAYQGDSAVTARLRRQLQARGIQHVDRALSLLVDSVASLQTRAEDQESRIDDITRARVSPTRASRSPHTPDVSFLQADQSRLETLKTIQEQVERVLTPETKQVTESVVNVLRDVFKGTELETLLQDTLFVVGDTRSIIEASKLVLGETSAAYKNIVENLTHGSGVGFQIKTPTASSLIGVALNRHKQIPLVEALMHELTHAVVKGIDRRLRAQGQAPRFVTEDIQKLMKEIAAERVEQRKQIASQIREQTPSVSYIANLLERDFEYFTNPNELFAFVGQALSSQNQDLERALRLAYGNQAFDLAASMLRTAMPSLTERIEQLHQRIAMAQRPEETPAAEVPQSHPQNKTSRTVLAALTDMIRNFGEQLTATLGAVSVEVTYDVNYNTELGQVLRAFQNKMRTVAQQTLPRYATLFSESVDQFLKEGEELLQTTEATLQKVSKALMRHTGTFLEKELLSMLSPTLEPLSKIAETVSRTTQTGVQHLEQAVQRVTSSRAFAELARFIQQTPIGAVTQRLVTELETLERALAALGTGNRAPLTQYVLSRVKGMPEAQAAVIAQLPFMQETLTRAAGASLRNIVLSDEQKASFVFDAFKKQFERRYGTTLVETDFSVNPVFDLETGLVKLEASARTASGAIVQLSGTIDQFGEIEVAFPSKLEHLRERIQREFIQEGVEEIVEEILYGAIFFIFNTVGQVKNLQDEVQQLRNLFLVSDIQTGLSAYTEVNKLLQSTITIAAKTGQSFEDAVQSIISTFKMLAYVPDFSQRRDLALQLTSLQLSGQAVFGLSQQQGGELVPSLISQLSDQIRSERPDDTPYQTVAETAKSLQHVYNLILLAQRESGAAATDILQVFTGLLGTVSALNMTNEELVALSSSAAVRLGKSPEETLNSIKFFLERLYAPETEKKLKRYGIYTRATDETGQITYRSLSSIVADIQQRIAKEPSFEKMVANILGARARASEVIAILRSFEDKQRIEQTMLRSATGLEFEQQAEFKQTSWEGAINSASANIGNFVQTVLFGTGIVDQLGKVIVGVTYPLSHLADIFVSLGDTLLVINPFVRELAETLLFLFLNVGKSIANTVASLVNRLVRPTALSSLQDIFPLASIPKKALQLLEENLTQAQTTVADGATRLAKALETLDTSLQTKFTELQHTIDRVRQSQADVSLLQGGLSDEHSVPTKTETLAASIQTTAARAAAQVETTQSQTATTAHIAQTATLAAAQADAVETKASVQAAQADTAEAKASTQAAHADGTKAKVTEQTTSKLRQFASTVAKLEQSTRNVTDFTRSVLKGAQSNPYAPQTLLWDTEHMSALRRGIAALGEVTIPVVFDVLSSFDSDVSFQESATKIGAGIAGGIAGALLSGGNPLGALIGYQMAQAFASALDLSALWSTSEREQMNVANQYMQFTPEQRAKLVNLYTTGQLQRIREQLDQAVPSFVANTAALFGTRELAILKTIVEKPEPSSDIGSRIAWLFNPEETSYAYLQRRYQQEKNIQMPSEVVRAFLLYEQLAAIDQELPALVASFDVSTFEEFAALLQDIATKSAPMQERLEQARRDIMQAKESDIYVSSVADLIAQTEKALERVELRGRREGLPTSLSLGTGYLSPAHGHLMQSFLDALETVPEDQLNELFEAYQQAMQRQQTFAQELPMLAKMERALGIDSIVEQFQELGFEGQRAFLTVADGVQEAIQYVEEYETLAEQIALLEQERAKYSPITAPDEYEQLTEVIDKYQERLASMQQLYDLYQAYLTSLQREPSLLAKAFAVARAHDKKARVVGGSPARFRMPSLFDVSDYTIEDIQAALREARAKQADILRMFPQMAEEFAKEQFIFEAGGQYAPVTGVSLEYVRDALQKRKKETRVPEIVDLRDYTADQVQKIIQDARMLQEQATALAPALATEYQNEQLLLLQQNNDLLLQTGLSQEFLRYAIEQNTKSTEDNTDQLRGHYNLPASYRPPTIWDYYASGGTSAGSVNYVPPPSPSQGSVPLDLARTIAQASLQASTATETVPDLSQLGSLIDPRARPLGYPEPGTPGKVIFPDMMELPEGLQTNELLVNNVPLADILREPPKKKEPWVSLAEVVREKNTRAEQVQSPSLSSLFPATTMLMQAPSTSVSAASSNTSLSLPMQMAVAPQAGLAASAMSSFATSLGDAMNKTMSVGMTTFQQATQTFVRSIQNLNLQQALQNAFMSGALTITVQVSGLSQPTKNVTATVTSGRGSQALVASTGNATAPVGKTLVR